MVSCLAYADTVLAERFVQGIEVAVSVVEDDTEPRARCPPVEVEAKGGVYDYTARYTPGRDRFPLPGSPGRRGVDHPAGDRTRRPPAAGTA